MVFEFHFSHFSHFEAVLCFRLPRGPPTGVTESALMFLMTQKLRSWKKTLYGACSPHHCPAAQHMAVGSLSKVLSDKKLALDFLSAHWEERDCQRPLDKHLHCCRDTRSPAATNSGAS